MTEPFGFEEARDRLRDATRIVLEHETAYEQAAARAADSEAVYRRRLAEKMEKHREAGKAVEESLTLARSDVVLLSRERDYSASLLKLAGEQLENARDSRRSLWRLVEWARERDLAVARASSDGAASP